MPNIIVEGPDGAGKTTLTEMLRERVKRRYFVMLRHSCRPYTWADAIAFLDLINRTPIQLTMVIDRHPIISEPIYGPILRGKDLLEAQSDEWKLSVIQHTSDFVVYCRPPRGTIIENLSKQPQLAGVAEKIDQLIEAYDIAIERLRAARVRVYVYDWTNPDSFNHVVKQLFGEHYGT